MVRIAIIGSGVIGLSSGVRLLEAFPKAEVTVMADMFPPFTTTDVSGGFWEPHLLGDTPEEKIREWSGKTMEHMVWLASTDCARYTGAQVVHGYQCSENEDTKVPFWSDMCMNFKVLEKEELKRFPDMKSGFFYTVPMVEPSMYLQWLMKRFQRYGGRLKKRFVKDLQEVACEGYDVIVNCTGLGARGLVGDVSVVPVRGQVIRAHAPWLKEFAICAFDDKQLAYILPSMNFVVMGGTEYHDDWDKEPRASDRKRIWDLCTKYVPSLTEATVESDHVGLRPSRSSVRLELDSVIVDGKRVPVVHNYGHGGAGVTLHWGCAENAVTLVKQALQANGHVSAKL